MFRLRTLFDRRAVEREIDDELRFHLEMEASARQRDGLDAVAAQRQAARLFGGVESTKDDLRDRPRRNGVENVLKDVRYAVRALRRNPGFTSVAVLTLALGIGANAALFSVVNGVLLRPLPYPEADRLVSIRNVWGDNRNPLDAVASISPAEYFDYRDRMTAFESFGVYTTTTLSLTGDGEPERLSAACPVGGGVPDAGRRTSGGPRDRVHRGRAWRERRGARLRALAAPVRGRAGRHRPLRPGQRARDDSSRRDAGRLPSSGAAVGHGSGRAVRPVRPEPRQPHDSRESLPVRHRAAAPRGNAGAGQRGRRRRGAALSDRLPE
jgi:hypothetical protein